MTRINMSNKIIEKMDLFYYCTMLVTGLGKLTVLGHRIIHYLYFVLGNNSKIERNMGLMRIRIEKKRKIEKN